MPQIGNKINVTIIIGVIIGTQIKIINFISLTFLHIYKKNNLDIFFQSIGQKVFKKIYVFYMNLGKSIFFYLNFSNL